MAKDINKHRRMYQSPAIFFIIIPLGMIAMFFTIDFFYKNYVVIKANNDIKDIYRETLDKEGLETNQDLMQYMEKKFIDYGYGDYHIDFNITDKKDYKLLIVYLNYYSLINQLTNQGSKITVIRLKGYYDKNKKTVIEEYDIDKDDDLIDSVDTEPYTTTRITTTMNITTTAREQKNR